MGSMIQKITAIFFVCVLQGNLIFATFYSPYDFNRHLQHFQRKNYQFWHELYRNNYEPGPYLRFNQPGFISSGALNKVQALDAVPLITSTNENINNPNQWSGLNDVYGFGLRYPNPVDADQNVPTSSVIPPTKRTTRPRTTYTTRERTTVSLSTDEITRPTVEVGAGNEMSSTEGFISPTTPKPTKSPSELLAQIAQVNSSAQNILGQLGKPSRKPGTSGVNLSGGSGGRPSASQLLQQIQKVNSSAQNLLVTLKPKPNTKFLGYEIRDEMVWTTARTTEPDTPVISITNSVLEEVKPISTPIVASVEMTDKNKTTNNMDKIETTSVIEDSSEKMVLVSTSQNNSEKIESRNTEVDITGIETTQMPDEDKTETTTDPMQEDLDELDNRHEEYELETSGIMGMMEMDDVKEEKVTTTESDDTSTETPVKTEEAANRMDEEDLTTEPDNMENEVGPVTTEATTETVAFGSEDETTTVVTETTTFEPEEESNVDQELIEFIIIDIITTASALQNVINTIINPIGVSLSPEFSLLEALLTSAQESRITTPEVAEQIDVQILKITSNIGLKRLRSTKILELTQRLTKMGKLLKLSVSNI